MFFRNGIRTGSLLFHFIGIFLSGQKINFVEPACRSLDELPVGSGHDAEPEFVSGPAPQGHGQFPAGTQDEQFRAAGDGRFFRVASESVLIFFSFLKI